jgi:hypothetical protein
VRRPQLFRRAGRVERVAEADEPSRAGLVGDHARDPPSHRLAPDDDPVSPAEALDHLEPARAQDGLAVRRAPPALGPAPRHVRKLEPRDGEAAGREAAGDAVHEGRVHRSARAVRERDRERRVGGSVEEESVGHGGPRREAYTAATCSA